jgi:hypothetical protein
MWNIRLMAVIGTFTITSLAATAFYAYSKGRQDGKTLVQARWDAERLAVTASQAEEAMKARQKEHELQATLAQQRKEHQNEVRRIGREHAALVDSLRQRSDRPAEGATGVPQAANPRVEPATGCTGTQLYRQDGEFLAREAARADQLRIALRTCIADRAEIERQLN